MVSEKIPKSFERSKEKLNSYLKYLNPILDFLAIQDNLQKTDVVFVFGSTKHYVAEHAAKIYLDEFAPYILISGHKSERSNNLHKKTEADFMRKQIIKSGIPEDKIITEYKATNTLENVILGMKELEKQTIKVKSAILIAKPFHLRRCRATFKKQFPNIKTYCSYPEMTFAEYLSYEMVENEITEIKRTEKEIIKRIVGEIDRLKIYAEKGDIIKQEIPPDVEVAAEKLIKLIKNSNV